MTALENKVRQCELDVRKQESQVREAKLAMEEGYKKLQAEMEREYGKLKGAYEREQIELEKEKAYLAAARAEAEQGFEK